MDAQVRIEAPDLNRITVDPSLLGLAPEPLAPGSAKFADKFLDMGLAQGPVGVFSYTDQFGSVQYKKLQSIEREEIPYLGIYTKAVGKEDFEFIGVVSNSYQFVGHDSINAKIREMVSEVGTPIFIERPHLSGDISEMINEIVIRNVKHDQRVGDICPQLTTANAYNGHKAVTVAFGFCVIDGHDIVGAALRNRLGCLRQIHLLSSKSKMVSAVSQFVQIFNDNILNTIEMNFNTQIVEANFLSFLDMIEQRVGKRKRDDISTYVADVYGTQLNAWNLFNALCKFSVIEKHINTRILLENIAEKVLVLPYEFSNMMQALTKG